MDHHEADGRGQADCFGEARFRGAGWVNTVAFTRAGAFPGEDDRGADWRRARIVDARRPWSLVRLVNRRCRQNRAPCQPRRRLLWWDQIAELARLA